MVRTHSATLAQLLDNVLDNAAKYSPAGTPIRIRISAAETTVECSVEDSGSGIAPEDLPHIFEPFYRSDEVRGDGELPGLDSDSQWPNESPLRLGARFELRHRQPEERDSPFVCRKPASMKARTISAPFSVLENRWRRRQAYQDTRRREGNRR